MTAATKELPYKAFKLTNGRFQDTSLQLYNGNATSTASCEVKGLVSFRWSMSNDEPLPVMRIKGQEIKLPPAANKFRSQYIFDEPYTGLVEIAMVYDPKNHWHDNVAQFQGFQILA